MSFPNRPSSASDADSQEVPASGSGAMARLLRQARWEVIPLESLAEQIPHLPPGSPMSVTASPSKTLEDTLSLAEQLCAAGHRAVPHIAARMVASRGHLAELLGRVEATGGSEIFLVGGDAPDPAGPYDSAVALLEDLGHVEHSLTGVGVAAYPEGHALIADTVLHTALHAKQRVLADLGLSGHATTQMCFSHRAIRNWLRGERDAGLTLPVHLGIPGAVERARLVRVSARIGVGASLRYLQKNRRAVLRMFAPGGYDPAKLLSPLRGQIAPLGIRGLHVFTINAVKATIEWRDRSLSELR